MMSEQSQNTVKQLVGTTAADLVEDGMLVGLGTGSTAYYFIERLIQRQKEGLSIKCVATSSVSANQAVAGGLEVLDMDQIDTIDLTVDGADEIDPQKRMIKGGGGALLKEKIVATASREMIVIVDASKLVDRLGAFPLPVEVVRFGARATKAHLEQKGFPCRLRSAADGSPFITDEGHYIFDIQLPMLLDDPVSVHEQLLSTVGVVETGLFFNIAGRVIVGHPDGKIEIRP